MATPKCAWARRDGLPGSPGVFRGPMGSQDPMATPVTPREWEVNGPWTNPPMLVARLSLQRQDRKLSGMGMGIGIGIGMVQHGLTITHE